MPDPETVYRELRSVLVTMLQDKTASASSRASVASSLAGLCFLGGGEMAEVGHFFTDLSGVQAMLF